MMTAESQQLLAAYVASGSEPAFQELVARYVDLVYSAALRLVEGDAHRAQDVAQTVFIDLARMAPKLSPNTLLGGWLHRHTCFVARTLMRGERRRQARERQAVEMSALDNHPDAALAEVAAVLDEAIYELGPDDRDAILLRFFERRNLRSVGEALGTNENVAQKRVARAVQELATLLHRRGFTLSAAALAAGLTTGAVNAAPAGLALALTKGALAGAGLTGSTAGSAAKLALMAKLKVGLLSLIAVAGLGTMVWLQFPSRARHPNGSQFAQAPPSDPQSAEPQAAAATPSRPLRFAQTPPAAPPSQPSPASPPVATPALPAGGRSAEAPAATPEETFPVGAAAQRFNSQAGSRLRIQGTSNLGNWSAESTTLQGFVETEPSFFVNLNHPSKLGPVLARADVLIPVSSFRSSDAQGNPSLALDASLQRLLAGKGDPQPQLWFHLTGLTFDGHDRADSTSYVFHAQGNLAVAGVTNALRLPMSLRLRGGGKLRLAGDCNLALTTFGIQPDALTRSTGGLKLGNSVSIQLDWFIAASDLTSTAPHPGWVPLLLDLPAPGYKGLPASPPGTASWLEPVSLAPRPPLLVPLGLVNLARGAKLTTSDGVHPPYELAKITDGDKEAQSALYLRKGAQWVELDLGRPCEVYAVVLWHAHDAAKIYHDVVVQIANAPGCQQAVHTLFNNDRTNALGLGAGTNRDYFETFEGKLIEAQGVTGQYLRFYSKGSTQSALNEYTEIEVYGRRAH